MVVDVMLPGQARLDVVDDGPGIPTEERERVFDRFYRTESARPRGPGSGLGLAIARGLVERNGGSLKVEPGPGGARLRLLLPTVPG
jgi:signal transduction histidine kinase